MKSKQEYSADKNFYIRQEHMIKFNNRCFYCNTICINDSKRNKFYNDKKMDLPANTATVEHLHPDYDLRRFLIGYNDHTVLACHKCNTQKNIEFRKTTNPVSIFVNIVSILKTGNIICCLNMNGEMKRHFNNLKKSA